MLEPDFYSTEYILSCIIYSDNVAIINSVYFTRVMQNPNLNNAFQHAIRTCNDYLLLNGYTFLKKVDYSFDEQSYYWIKIFES